MSADEPDPVVLKQLAELADGDQWQMADLLARQFPPDEYGDGSKANTGLYEALRTYEVALHRDYGVELKASVMRTYRATALAWPHGLRSPSASFAVHRMLRGEDRISKMQRYLRLNGGRPLSVRVVRRFRYDDNPPPKGEWEVKLRRSIASAVKSKLLGGRVTKRPDWWNVAGPNDREAAVAALLELARAMQGES